MKALIIAAGKGHRLRKNDDNQPKPLYKVAGLPLIERVILSSKKAGITEFVIVIGFKGDEIRNHLVRKQKSLGVSIEFVTNEEWEKSNGHSVLKAKEHLNDNFVLLMSDHVFDWNILADFIKRQPLEGQILLAVDRRTDAIFDPEDATKVKTGDEVIVRIGKELPEFDAIDTGIFHCSPGLIPALEKACATGKGSLSEAIQILADQGKARTFTIGNRFWQDVDTPSSLKIAEQALLCATRKPETDGFIARHLNRRVSSFISRLLVKTPVSPNQVTWSALAVGLLSSFLVSTGVYWKVALGGVLFQFASIYDGCDGEVAKLKMASTKYGEWLDTTSDSVTYIVFLIAVMVGAHRQGSINLLPLSALTLFGAAMALFAMFYCLVKFTDSGSLVTVQKELYRDMEAFQQNILVRLVSKVRFMMKRDFFALFFMTLCLFNRLEGILIWAAIGTNLTWIVLLTVKREFTEKSPALQED